MLNKFIAIEGNIGSGKTTLAIKLAKDMNFRLILEQFSDNPFLPDFYDSKESNSLALELSFLAERYHQLKKEQEQDMFRSGLISDYFFMKSKLFAQNNLQDDEIQLFNSLFDIMSPSLSQPDLVIYLYSDVKKLQDNIKKRGRSYEKNISDVYLENIQARYLDYLRKQHFFPVLILNVSNVDFEQNKSAYNQIKKILNQEYSIDVYQFDLS